MASGHVNRTNRPNTWLLRPLLQRVKNALANPEPSTRGPTRTTSALQQVVCYLGYSGRDADVVVTAALDPLQPSAIDQLCYAPMSAWQHESTYRNSTMRVCQRK